MGIWLAHEGLRAQCPFWSSTHQTNSALCRTNGAGFTVAQPGSPSSSNWWRVLGSVSGWAHKRPVPNKLLSSRVKQPLSGEVFYMAVGTATEILEKDFLVVANPGHQIMTFDDEQMAATFYSAVRFHAGAQKSRPQRLFSQMRQDPRS